MMSKSIITKTAWALLLLAISLSPSFAAEEKADEEQLISILKNDGAPLHERARACERLSVTGGAKAIPALADLLGDETLGDYARFTLERIEDPEVDRVFREALGKLKGLPLAGVVNSIGVRRDEKAVGGLIKLADDPASGVVPEALSALGKIATDEAVNTIVQALNSKKNSVRTAAADACLTAAEHLMNQGEKTRAIELFDAISKADTPKSLQGAAAYNAILARGDEGVSRVIENLQSGDAKMRDMALRAARELPGEKTTRALVAGLRELEVESRKALLSAISDRGDDAAQSLMETLAAEKGEPFRLEAIRYLGESGKSSSVAPLLAAVKESENDQVSQAGLAALIRINTDGVSERILDALHSAEAPIRVKLIGALASRRAEEATPGFLTQAADSNPDVQSAAFQALAVLAGPESLPQIINEAINSQDEKVRRSAERAAVSVTRRMKDGADRDDVVVAALAETKDSDARQALIRILGGIGNSDALKAIQNELESSDAAIRDTAVRQLVNWPDAEAIDVLSDLMKSAGDNTHRVLALRGYVRLLGLHDQISVEKALQGFRNAMEYAKRPEERRLVLAGLAGTGSARALEPLGVLLKDEAIREEAALAIKKIAGDARLKLPEGVKTAEEIIDFYERQNGVVEVDFDSIEPVSLFDGKTFEGWEGDLKIFRIEGGAIVGGTLDKPVPRNEFLCATREFSDFELRLKFKLERGIGNAGIQIRSRRIPNHHEMIGYQADIGQTYWGCLYDESRRNQVLAAPDKATLERAMKVEDWNDYVIRCEGRRIRLWLNGVQTVDYTEPDESIEQTGLIGLQIHGGPASEIRYRDISIRAVGGE